MDPRSKSENLLPRAEKSESDSNAVDRKTEHNRQSAFQMGKRKIKNCLGVIYNPNHP